MKHFSSAILLSLSICVCSAQNQWTVYPAKDSIDQSDTTSKTLEFNSAQKSEVIVNQDPRINKLKTKLADEKNILGYTIQIEVSQQNQIIKAARLKFIKSFPDTPIFDEYIAPNTYLFVGRYYDKNDAIAFQNTITSAFSNTMVIKKRILPPLLKK